MRIGLDYDGTITADPNFWLSFCINAEARGIEVYIVTMRFESECSEVPTDFLWHTKGIYATGRKAKAAHMLARGIQIDVWIDDNPRAVSEDGKAIWGVDSPEGKPIDPCNP